MMPKHRDDTHRSVFAITDPASRATIRCAGCIAWDYSEECECRDPEPRHRATV